MTSIKSRPFFCSWSGGKDSCLALYRAIQDGGMPKVLLTMLTADGQRSRSHGLPVDLIRHQARALGLPLVGCPSSWHDYEDTFIAAIRKFGQDGITSGVFGDIDLEPHLAWVEGVCSSAAIEAHEPLWKAARRDILNEFLLLGFKATIISVKQGVLNDDFLGRTLDPRVIADLEKAGIDVSGEKGEYHTVVTDGPIFSCAIDFETKAQVVHDGYCFLDISLR